MLTPRSAEWRRLKARLRRLTGDDASAEDAIQSAHLRVEEYRARNVVHAPKALVVSTAVNLALDERRRLQRAPVLEIDGFSAVLQDEQPLPDEVLAARERLRQVQAALSRLPARTREAFLLHRVEGLKYREIAVRLGVSASAVEKHIAKATLLLAEAVEELDQGA